MSVEQSGNVTNGHLAKWVSPGVIADAGPQVAGQRVLSSLISADFNTTTDQGIVIPNSITAFQLTGIIVTNASVLPGIAVGGFYPQPSKAGSAIVSAGQGYSALTNPNVLMNLTLTAFAQAARFSASNLPNGTIYFSLTTPQGAVATADIYLIGIDLTPAS